MILFSTLGCLIVNIDIDGAAGCVKSTQAQRGTISVTFPVVNQIANIVISAPRNYKVILSCITVTNVVAFTVSLLRITNEQTYVSLPL